MKPFNSLKKRFTTVHKPIKRIHKDFPLLLAFNILGGILIFYCYMIGYLHTIIAADATGFMMYVIFGVAAVSIILGLYRSWFFMNQIRRLNKGQPLQFEINLSNPKKKTFELHISSLLHYPHICPQILTELGLIGTIAGILIMLTAMGGNVIGDASAAKGAMNLILSGYAVALYTTLAGLFFAIWTQIQNSVLDTQADRLLINITEKIND